MLTKCQDIALQTIKEWIRSKGKLFRLGGPAGSGKSYIIPLVADIVGSERVVLMTPTGKAAVNLQKAGLEAVTIHSAIYKVKAEEENDEEEDENLTEEARKDKEYTITDPEFLLKAPDTYINKELFIIDEGSMVGEQLLKDILSFNVPVLLVGDPHQLAPVQDRSVFNTCDFYLDEIVRQAKDSPIIWLSQQILEGKVPTGCFGSSIIRKGEPQDNELLYADQVLTDTNKRRAELNTKIRNLYFNEDVCSNPKTWIKYGDKLVCRTNTNAFVSTKGFPLTNGTQGTVTEIMHTGLYSAGFALENKELGEFVMQGTQQPLKFPKNKRPPTVEYGYTLTVHLSQGSEWNNVIYDVSKGLQKRALYTGVTRAKQSLLVTL